MSLNIMYLFIIYSSFFVYPYCYTPFRIIIIIIILCYRIAIPFYFNLNIISWFDIPFYCSTLDIRFVHTSVS